MGDLGAMGCSWDARGLEKLMEYILESWSDTCVVQRRIPRATQSLATHPFVVSIPCPAKGG